MGLAAALEGGWFVEDGDFAFDVGAAGVEDFGAGGLEFGLGGVALGEVAVCVGHRFGIAESGAGGGVEDAADGPLVVDVGEEDFAGALLFGAVIPAAEEREMVAEELEVSGFGGSFFKGADGLGCAVFG